MKIFVVALVFFVAACNARSISSEIQEWAPAVSIKSDIDRKEVTGGEIAVADQGVVVTTKIHKNGLTEVEGKYRGLTVGGDTNGEYYVNTDMDIVEVDTNFNQNGKLEYTGLLKLPALKGKLQGNRQGLQKYDVHAGFGGLGFGVNGDTKGVDTNYEANLALALVGDSANYEYGVTSLNGMLTADYKMNNRNYKGVIGTLWLGPIGAQIDYDTAGRLFYTLHLNVMNIGKMSVRMDGHSNALNYNAALQYGIEGVNLNVEANANNNGLKSASANLKGHGLHLQVKQSDKGLISGGLRYLRKGYGLKIDGDQNLKFQVGVVANDQTFMIPLGDFL